MIIVVVGLPSSGKTTALDTCREMGFSVVASGDVIRDEVKRRGLPYTKESDKKVAAWFHRDGREKLLIKRVLEKAKGDKIVIGGLRSFDQLGELKKQTGEKPIVISINADFETRLKRAEKRHRFPDGIREYLKQRDLIETKRGEKKLMEVADYTIDNNNLSLAKFKQNVRLLVKKIIGEKERKQRFKFKQSK